MLRGTVFGIMLTIGGVYLVDSMAPPESQIVNWNVASVRAGQIMTIARDKVLRLVDEARASFSSPSEPQRPTY